MNKFKPLNIENDKFLIHAMRMIDAERYSKIQNDLFEIFSDIETTKYTPEKKVNSIQALQDRFTGDIRLFNRGEMFTHYITKKDMNKVVGVITIIPPSFIEKNYEIKNTWFIEYFLHKNLWNKGIMTFLMKAVLNALRNREIVNVAALCNSENLNSLKLLRKIGFDIISLKENQYLLQLK